jgi:hypothetical protein
MDKPKLYPTYISHFPLFCVEKIKNGRKQGAALLSLLFNSALE